LLERWCLCSPCILCNDSVDSITKYRSIAGFGNNAPILLQKQDGRVLNSVEGGRLTSVSPIPHPTQNQTKSVAPTHCRTSRAHIGGHVPATAADSWHMRVWRTELGVARGAVARPYAAVSHRRMTHVCVATAYGAVERARRRRALDSIGENKRPGAYALTTWTWDSASGVTLLGFRPRLAACTSNCAPVVQTCRMSSRNAVSGLCRRKKHSSQFSYKIIYLQPLTIQSQV
jgi:hypothetical protein